MVSFVALTVALVGGAVVLRRVHVREPDRFIARVVLFGLFAKLAGSVARYTFMAELYDGVGDFQRYFDRGMVLASEIRSGSMPDQASETGSLFMDFLSGVMYAVLPARLWVGFLVFSLLAFTGAYLFLQAFRVAVPGGDHRRYAVLVMFMPTMLFWPSSIGKEAWLVFGLGLGTYGGARILRRLPGGYVVLAVGAAATYQVRPHMGALFAVAFAGAFLMRFRDPGIRRGAFAWMVGLTLVGAGTIFAAANFSERVPRDESVEGSAVDQVFAETDRRTSQGGSAFESQPVRSPADFLRAAVTVPFRPFPTEAHNLQARLTSLEGVLLLLLLLAAVPRMRALPRLLLRQPYLLMACAYTGGFIIAFANVGNFGLLTRQRAQLLPFIAVLLALPKVHEATQRRGSRAGATIVRASESNTGARSETEPLA